MSKANTQMVQCLKCQQMFFPWSLPFHSKACDEKVSSPHRPVKLSPSSQHAHIKASPIKLTSPHSSPSASSGTVREARLRKEKDLLLKRLQQINDELREFDSLKTEQPLVDKAPHTPEKTRGAVSTPSNTEKEEMFSSRVVSEVLSPEVKDLSEMVQGALTLSSSPEKVSSVNTQPVEGEVQKSEETAILLLESEGLDNSSTPVKSKNKKKKKSVTS